MLKKTIKEIEKLRSPEGYLYAGVPRFRGLFGRDSLISAWQVLGYDSEIAKKTLLILAKLQGRKLNSETGEAPGKILHEYYSPNLPDRWWQKYKAPYHPELKRGVAFYTATDSTELFLFLLGEYYKKTQDRLFLRKLWGNAKMGLSWMIKFGDKDKDGLIEVGENDKRGVWKDSIERKIKIDLPYNAIEIVGYSFLAFKQMSYLADIMEEPPSFKRVLFRRMRDLQQGLEEFWVEREKYYGYILNKRKSLLVKEVLSNPGHLLISGILDRSKAEMVVKKLFGRQLWSDYGIRTLSINSKYFNPTSYQDGSVWPHDNWIIAQGLRKYGYEKEYQMVREAILRARKEIGFLPECYGVMGHKIFQISRACYPQAWASGALLNFLREK